MELSYISDVQITQLQNVSLLSLLARRGHWLAHAAVFDRL
jgi:hypothetical protein